jgi:hypothetical protein
MDEKQQKLLKQLDYRVYMLQYTDVKMTDSDIEYYFNTLRPVIEQLLPLDEIISKHKNKIMKHNTDIFSKLYPEIVDNQD